ncbi:MAG: hypothetical protein R6U78_12120 [Bacteroidales bacterium]
MKKIISITLFISSLTGCYWDNEEDLFPVDLCDTVDVSFSGDVIPILTNNCLSCHSNASAASFGNGITLEDYEDIAAASSRIVGAINHEDGFSPMPRNQEKLDTCLIRIIETWVNDGVPNN